MTAVQLLIGLATLVVNAFFVGAEFALISVRRSQIEPRADQGDRRAKSVLWGLEHVSALMAAAQLGITLCTLVLGVVAEPAIAHLLEPVFHAMGVPSGAGHAVSFVIALTLATYLHMLLGEMVPKNVALAEPVRSALLLGPPLVALSRGLRPVIFTVNAFANALLRLLRVEVRDVVLPLERVVYASVGVTPEGLERLSAESGFSRFPVVDDGRRIVGYLHVKDALDASPRDLPFRLRDMRPIARVRESTPLDDVLTAMRGSRTHLAAVIGADGRLAGLVTMADVLQELFGQRAEQG